MEISYSFFKKVLFLTIGFVFILLSFGFSQTIIPFTTPGTTTWTVPPCVTSITVQAWGGGGGGGGSTSRQGGSGSEWEACSQGGGGGGFASRTYSVTPGEVYTIVVGAGGNGGVGSSGNSSSVAANNGFAGGISTFSGPATLSTGTLTAFGGGFGGGAWSNNTSGFSHIGYDGAAGTGGAGGINGTTYFQGGNGSSGRHSASCYDVSGAGGGGAGSSGNGGFASSDPSCTIRMGGSGGATDGGAGANGKKLNSYAANKETQNGNVGNTIGGGGSGSMIHLYSWTNSWVTANGGAGARGEIRIIYTPTGNVAAQPSPISGSVTLPCGGGTEGYSVVNVPGVTYSWSFSGSGTISGSGNSVSLTATTGGTLTVIPTADCEGPAQTLAITIAPLNPGVASLTNTTFCGTGSTVLSLAGFVGNIQWQQSTNGGITWTDISGATTSPYTVNGITGTTIYRAVISSSGCTSVNSNSVTITLTQSVTPGVSIQLAPSGTICSGTTITFTANPSNGGTAPTYQWQVNGVNIAGQAAATFSSSTLNDGDVVTVNMVSNGACLTTPNATASSVPLVFSNPITPSVTISGAPTTSICIGSSVTFTANPTNGGTNPGYQWQVNGVNIAGATNATYTSTSLSNNDVVTVVLTSNANCLTSPTASASTPAILVGGNIVPSVVISGMPTAPICSGIEVTFTANPTNGGTNPTYQWQVNGVNVAGETGNTFTTSSLNNNDVISVAMVSNDPCVSAPNATSPSVTIQIGGTLVPIVVISGAPTTPICPGVTVTFTANATNGGSNPIFQWQINGVNVPNENGNTFTPSTLNDNDVITVSMVSNDPCVTSPNTTSLGVTIQIGGLLVPSVSISATPMAPICFGTSVTFTANPTNGGTNPTYQWQINGVNLPTATGSNYTSTTLMDGDVVSVVMTSNDPCADPLIANNFTTIVVQQPVTPTVLIAVSSAPICPGDPVVFTLTSTNGGTNPTYQWQVNGANVNNATSSTFTTTNLTGTELISVTLTSNGVCLTSNSASNSTNLDFTLGQGNEFDKEFPNVITPNGDGLNDFLDLDAFFSSCIEYQLIILNRWGNVVYEQQNGDTPFEGKDLSGGVLTEGVYFYKLLVNQKESLGFLTIIR